MVISYLGNIVCLVLLGLLLHSIYRYLFKKDLGFATNHVVTVVFILLFSLVVFAFVTSDFSLNIVLNNSHSDKPLLYKVAGVWGNHEGSFLLLTMLISLIAFLARNSALKYKIATEYSFILNSILFFLLAYICLASNPFVMADTYHEDGFGLNPILQDFILAIHPPILYLGYAASFLNFIIVLAFLLKGKKMEVSDFNFIFYVALLAQFFLSLGIGLGSFWAYRELGWGGFWFWDPVENVSLMPWLIGLVLLHFAMVARKKVKWHGLTLFMALLSGYFCFIGFFLVRSGVLQSVHSFASDPTRGMFLLIILTLFVAFSLMLYSRNLKNVLQDKEEISNVRYSLISLNYYLLMAILAVIFLATIYPLILQIFENNISIGAEYFNKSLLPLVTFLLISMIATNYTSWKGFIRKEELVKLSMSIVPTLILLYFVRAYFRQGDIFLNLLIIVGIALFCNMFLSYFILRKKGKGNFSMFIGHTGFALLMFSVGLFGTSKHESNFLLRPGEEIQFHDYKITFEKYEFARKENYMSAKARFLVLDRDNNLTILVPEKRIYVASGGETSEAAIMRDKIHDLYLAFGKFYGDSIKLRVYFNPFMNFIWLSFFLIAVSFFVKPMQNLVKCRREVL